MGSRLNKEEKISDMKRKIYILTWNLWLFLVCLVSCNTDEMGKDIDEPKLEEVPLFIPFTKAVNDGNVDNKIVSARLIIFDTKTHRVLINTYKSPAEINSSSIISFKEIVKVGNIDLFLIANEISTWSLNSFNVGSIISPEQLKNKILSFSTYPSVSESQQIPMFGKFENIYIDTKGRTFLSNGQEIDLSSATPGTVERLYSKVSLNINCDFSKLLNDGEAIEIESVSMVRMPKSSFLSPGRYKGSSTSDFIMNAASISPTSSNIGSNGFNMNYLFYIPEYLVDNTTLYNYLSVVTRLKETPSTKKSFKIAVCDSIKNNNAYLLGGTANASELTVSRNTHYNIKATIVSFEETSNTGLDIVAKIIDWNEGGTTTPDPEVYSLTLSESSFKIGSTIGIANNPYEGVVTVTTSNPAGWTAKSTSSGLTIVSTTNDKLTFKIAASTSVSSWTIDVVTGKVTKQIKITRN